MMFFLCVTHCIRDDRESIGFIHKCRLRSKWLKDENKIIYTTKNSKNWLSEYPNFNSKILETHCQKYLLRRQFINMMWLNSSDKKLLQNHLPSDGDYLLMLSDFLAIVLLSLTRRGKYVLHFSRNSKIWIEKSEDSCCVVIDLNHNL